jgi:uncharacterized protein YktB (UPF0637 family)
VATLGFTPTDFAVFALDDLSARMEKIYEHVRPRLIRLGQELAPELSRKLHMELHSHVAKHIRRTINPPQETWVAFGPSPRAYKRNGYLALCISSAGLHARAVVKSEAAGRPQISSSLKQCGAQLAKDFDGTRIARYDQWDFERLPAPVRAEPELFAGLAEILSKKTGSIDLGFGWNVRESLRLDRAEMIEAFHELAPLYRIFVQAPEVAA